LTGIFLGTFFLALLSAIIFTRFVRDFANAHGWVAVPTHERHLHSTPLPRLGGVAIFLSSSLCMGVIAIWGLRHPESHSPAFLPALVTIVVPASVVFLLGVYDDLRGAGPYFKFAVQGIAATMLYAGGLRIVHIPVLFGQRVLPWYVGLLCTVIWVLAITNAFNLIDGLDGLAAGCALFSTMVAFVVALFHGPTLVEVMTIALAGAIIGFLRYNFNPATIFLGDSGSLYIGFLLSALALYGTQKSPTIVAVAIPIVSFGLPILETSLSILRRLISGRPVFTADREHIHHKLLQHGLSHRQVVVLLYGVSAGFAMLSLFLLWPTGSSLGLVLAVLGTGIWMGVQHLDYLEFGELARVAQRTLDQPQIFVNNLAIRRAVKDLKAARDFEQVRNILVAAFATNDFDAFDLELEPSAAEMLSVSFEADSSSDSSGGSCFRWSKPGVPQTLSSSTAWRIALHLLTSNGAPCGTLTVLRFYSERDLQIDINLLTAGFPTALADALHRTLAHPTQFAGLHEHGGTFLEAQAG
jgi:UDP-GlcNAc:undecaprenyl-phosphate/decaprenyl-phosphate GlcNAc-1-phosphate transferase